VRAFLRPKGIFGPNSRPEWLRYPEYFTQDDLPEFQVRMVDGMIAVDTECLGYDPVDANGIQELFPHISEARIT
jgi:hypothetical protein